MKQRFRGLFLFVLLAVGAAIGQSKKPLSEGDLIELLKNYVPPNQVAELARQKGINFAVTGQVVSDLKGAGADNALIESLRDLAPKQEQPATPVAKAPKTNPKDGQKYIWIPPGTFQMGCSPEDAECFNEEKPAHNVTITKGFWIAQTAVTVDAWKRYRVATGAKALPESDHFGWTNWNEANGNGSIPAVMLTWDEAKAFCEWTGGRLPTEAEWEYAARAGNTSARYGNLDDIAWYGDNSGNQRIDSTSIRQTDAQHYVTRLKDNGNFVHPVGQKQPNAWELYDMLGNVWQWTADWYGERYYEQREATDPQGPPGGQFRVLRGGSWYDDPRFVRVSFRYRIGPGNRSYVIGARCVGDADPSVEEGRREPSGREPRRECRFASGSRSRRDVTGELAEHQTVTPARGRRPSRSLTG